MTVAAISLSYRGGMRRYVDCLVGSLDPFFDLQLFAPDYCAGARPIGLHSTFTKVRALLRVLSRLRLGDVSYLLVLSNHPFHLVAILAGRLYGATPVYLVHDPVEHPGVRWSLRAVRRIVEWLAQRYSGVVVVHSPTHLVQLHHGPVRKRVVIPVGAELQDLPLSLSTVPTYCVVGRLEPYKGLDMLQRALRRLPSLEGHLIVAGHGNARMCSDATTICELWRRLGGSAEVHLHTLSEVEVRSFHARASFSIAPYTHVTSSAVVARSMGAGNIVMVTKLPELHSVLGDPPGVIWLAPDDLVGSLADALYKSQQDYEPGAILSERAKIRSWTEAHLGWERVARYWVRMLTPGTEAFPRQTTEDPIFPLAG